MLEVRGRRLTFRLGLRNAFEELLTVDPRLVDEAYARAKLEEIVSGRLEVLRVIEESCDVAEARARMAELARRFEWLRALFVEDPEA